MNLFDGINHKIKIVSPFISESMAKKLCDVVKMKNIDLMDDIKIKTNNSLNENKMIKNKNQNAKSLIEYFAFPIITFVPILTASFTYSSFALAPFAPTLDAPEQ